jgi:hypothetical protein
VRTPAIESKEEPIREEGEEESSEGGGGGKEEERSPEVKGKRRSGAGLATPALKRQKRPGVDESSNEEEEADSTEQAADGGPETTPKKAAAVSTENPGESPPDTRRLRRNVGPPQNLRGRSEGVVLYEHAGRHVHQLLSASSIAFQLSLVLNSGIEHEFVKVHAATASLCALRSRILAWEAFSE